MGRRSEAREKLIDAARTLMWDRGFVDVGVQELCAEAGVRPGSFYYFFPSKAALTVEALEAQWSVFSDRMLTPALALDDPLDRLRHFFSEMHRSFRETHQATGHVGGCPFGNMSGELQALDEPIREKLREVFDRQYAFFETIVRDARDRGLISAGDVPQKARAVLAMLQGMQTLAHTYNDPDVIATLTPEVFRLLEVESAASDV
ncbi:TetR/AcrR family transcriptional regulator [Rhodocaloribacter sp.]